MIQTDGLTTRLIDALAERLARVAPPGLVVSRTADGIDFAVGIVRQTQVVRDIIEQAVGELDENIETAARSVLGGMQEVVMDVFDEEWPVRSYKRAYSQYPPSPEAQLTATDLRLWWADAAGEAVLSLEPIPRTVLFA